MLKFIQILTIIFTLTASALARGYPSWFCYYQVGPLEPGDVGPTHHCCDQYENNGTPGVKFTGSWASKCNDPQYKIGWEDWDTCCIAGGADGGNYD